MFAYPDGRYGEVHIKSDGSMMGRRLLDELEAAESRGVADGMIPDF